MACGIRVKSLQTLGDGGVHRVCRPEEHVVDEVCGDEFDRVLDHMLVDRAARIEVLP